MGGGKEWMVVGCIKAVSGILVVEAAARGGGIGDVEPTTGFKGASCRGLCVSARGASVVGGASVATALHLIKGSPDVPGGQEHIGMSNLIEQSAFLPQ